MREWTVMIYMAGDNDLDSNGLKDLMEMKRVGSTDEVAIVAQFDRSGKSHHTKRYFIRSYNQSPRLRDDVVKDLGETDSGSKEELIEFLKWGGQYEAKRHLLILWGHATGVDDKDIYATDRTLSKASRPRRGVFRPRLPNAGRRLVEMFNLDASADRFLLGLTDNNYELIATDDEAESFLDNIELKQALEAAGQPIDILGMDACLMSMAEICYQVQANVGISVASQAQTEQEGWPYERFLSKLVATPEMSPEQLSRVLVTEFVQFYEDHEDVSTALAACRLNKSRELASAVDSLAGALLQRLSDTATLNGIIAARRFVWSDEAIETVDLMDLCGLLRRHCSDSEIDDACIKVIEFLDNFFVSFDRTAGEDVRFAHGLGIYFPQYEVSETYQRLDFVKDNASNDPPSAPKWAIFIQKYIEATTR